MGCRMCKGLLKHDEVSPISIRPLYVTEQPRSQTTAKPTAIPGEQSLSQQHRQVTLTNEASSHHNSATNQNGSVVIAANEIIPSPNSSTNRNDSSVGLISETTARNEKGSEAQTSEITPVNSTNRKDSYAETSGITPVNSTNQNDPVDLTNEITPVGSNHNDSDVVTNQLCETSLSETAPETIETVQSRDEVEETAESVCIESEDRGEGVTEVKQVNSIPSEQIEINGHIDENLTSSEEIGDSQTPQPEAPSGTNQKAVVKGGITENGVDDDQINDDNSAACPTEENEEEPSTSPDPAAANAGFQMPEMEIEKVLDGKGCPITLGKFFGTWTVPWPWLPEQILRAQFFHFDDSDVILTGYAKSGSHWVWEMAHMLMRGRPEHCRTPKERLMLSFSTQEFFDTLPPPRVFNTHAPFQGFPAAIREGTNKCKIIYLLRNPKDVAVSYYHHLINQVDFEYEGTFHGYLDLFLEGKIPGGSWFDYVLGWEQTLEEHSELAVQVLYYEDVKEDTVAALQTLNEFLGLNRDPALLREIANQCTIGRMKTVDKELKERGPQHVNVSKDGKNFILRKGEVGDWQNWFSEEDDRRFMETVNNRMRNSHLRFRYLLGHKEEEEKGEEKEEEGEEKGEEGGKEEEEKEEKGEKIEEREKGEEGEEKGEEVGKEEEEKDEKGEKIEEREKGEVGGKEKGEKIEEGETGVNGKEEEEKRKEKEG